MKKIFLCFLFVLFFSVNTVGQTIVPDISARVDTSKVAIKEVYHLYKDYLNSSPDSIYRNPNWNSGEYDYYLKSKYLRVDRSANQMFNYYNSKQYFSYYKPTILQIDSINVNRYQIKTIFSAECPDKEYKKYTPEFITKLYAVRTTNNEFKLENCISYDTKNWKKYNYEFITYIVHPSCNFDEKEAEKAVTFCKKIAKQFGIKIKPFTYYILSNSDELGKLYNFEYWMSYLGGQTVIPLNEIFTTYGNANYPHEFVHMLFPMPKDLTLFCPMIINEGLATWLAGPGYGTSFEDGLRATSLMLQKQKSVTLDDIMTFKIRNEFDNNILYCTGGVICKMVYEKHGANGIWELYNSNKDNYQLVLEKQFGLSYDEIDALIISYIKSYAG